MIFFRTSSQDQSAVTPLYVKTKCFHISQRNELAVLERYNQGYIPGHSEVKTRTVAATINFALAFVGGLYKFTTRLLDRHAKLYGS